MVADPGHRQVAQHLVLLGQAIEGDRVAHGADDVVVGQHHPLGHAGGARGVEDDGEVRSLALGHLAREEPLMRGGEVAAFLADILVGQQIGPDVVAQAA